MKQILVERIIIAISFIAIGVVLFIFGGRDTASVVIDMVLALSGTIGLVLQVRIVFKGESNKQTIEVRNSTLENSPVVGQAVQNEKNEIKVEVTGGKTSGDTYIAKGNINVSPLKADEIVKPRSRGKQKHEDDLDAEGYDYDEKTVLTSDDDPRQYEFDVDKGDCIVGEIRADGIISVFITGSSGLKSYQSGQSFYPYWQRPRVKSTPINYSVKEAREHILFITHADEDEDEINLVVRLKTLSAEDLASPYR